ncbi:MAG TPA: zinc ribbon domain-containing protein [Candidatus Binataceae bacterium]|jgi:TM2 domain-containing membrane protein YozV|nr:zinc ribbon domain-containing protein [Candidatus Binataceae bacterium]
MPDSTIEKARYCSRCGEPVTVTDAAFCKECGAPLAGTVWLSPELTWRPMVAFVLSIVPGLGHLYKSQPGRGLLWFLFVLFMHVAAAPVGWIVHLICALNAALSGAFKEDPLRARGLSVTARPRS